MAKQLRILTISIIGLFFCASAFAGRLQPVSGDDFIDITTGKQIHYPCLYGGHPIAIWYAGKRQKVNSTKPLLADYVVPGIKSATVQLTDKVDGIGGTDRGKYLIGNLPLTMLQMGAIQLDLVPYKSSSLSITIDTANISRPNNITEKSLVYLLTVTSNDNFNTINSPPIPGPSRLQAFDGDVAAFVGKPLGKSMSIRFYLWGQKYHAFDPKKKVQLYTAIPFQPELTDKGINYGRGFWICGSVGDEANYSAH